jgi:transposase
MTRNLFWLSDEEWAAIQPGIVHMLKTGARWRDCPAEYGPYTTIYNRFNRWSKQGVWEDIFYVLSGSSGVIGTTSADSSSIKAHRSASGGKRGSSARRSGDHAADGRPRFMP